MLQRYIATATIHSKQVLIPPGDVKDLGFHIVGGIEEPITGKTNQSTHNLDLIIRLHVVAIFLCPNSAVLRVATQTRMSRVYSSQFGCCPGYILEGNACLRKLL